MTSVFYNNALEAETVRVSAVPYVNKNPDQFIRITKTAIQKFEALNNANGRKQSAWVTAHLGACKRQLAICESNNETIKELHNEAIGLLSAALGMDPPSDPGDFKNSLGNEKSRWTLSQLGIAYIYKGIFVFNVENNPEESLICFHLAIAALSKACGLKDDTYTEFSVSSFDDVVYGCAVAHLGLAWKGLFMLTPLQPGESTLPFEIPDEEKRLLLVKSLWVYYRCFNRSTVINPTYTWGQFMMMRTDFTVGYLMSAAGKVLSDSDPEFANQCYREATTFYQSADSRLETGVKQDFTLTGSKDIWDHYYQSTGEPSEVTFLWQFYRHAVTAPENVSNFFELVVTEIINCPQHCDMRAMYKLIVEEKEND